VFDIAEPMQVNIAITNIKLNFCIRHETAKDIYHLTWISRARNEPTVEAQGD
jgi:hypothetical protein